MKRRALFAAGLCIVFFTAVRASATAAAPNPQLDPLEPGVQAPMDTSAAVDWGKLLDNGDANDWTFSGGTASSASSGGSPRIIYFSSDFGAPDPRVNMPSTSWIAQLEFEYSGQLTSLLSMENDGSATKREVQVLGPGITGTPGEFRVDLRFGGVMAGPFQISENEPHTLTIHYLGLSSGNLMDVWVDDTLMGTGDLDALHAGAAYDANSFAIGGGSTIPGSMTIEVDSLIVGVPEPSTIVLLGLGASLAAVYRRRRA
jgi:hypothetical protein